MSFSLGSDRLQFRLAMEHDLPSIHQLLVEPEVDKYNTLGIPQDIEATQEIMAPLLTANQESPINCYTIALSLADSEKFIGLFGFVVGRPKLRRAEIWYKLIPDAWGKGYATEAASTMLDFGFQELDLHRITAGCAVENQGSIRVLEKIGMTREGCCRQALPLASGWSDNFEYAILAIDHSPVNERHH